jgi:hypothetical protein
VAEDRAAEVLLRIRLHRLITVRSAALMAVAEAEPITYKAAAAVLVGKIT